MKPGLACARELAMVNGGRRLMRCPLLALSSSCFANSRPCAAKASKGERSGGMSPALCSTRGEGNALGEGCPWRDEVSDLGGRSMKLGRASIPRLLGTIVPGRPR